jgi:hypothetical protein
MSGVVMASLFFPKPGQSIKGKIEELARAYEYIIVDEYTMTSLRIMENLYKLHKKGVKIIFVGDYRQIPQIRGNNEIRLKYMESQFFQEMCDYQYIELEKNYRFDKDLDKLCDEVYEKGVFSLKKAKYRTCRLNVCYTRKTRNAINNKFMEENKSSNKKILKGSKETYFVKNSPILCKINRTKNKLFNNRLFALKSWTKDTVYLQDGEETVSVSLEDFRGFNKKTKNYNFVPGHAFTDHCAQGSTLTGDICIWDSHLMSRNLLLTALSRATSIKHIFIHDYQELTNIKQEEFDEPGDITFEIDITKRAYQGYVYELCDKTNNKPFYVGSTSKTLKEREREHRKIVSSYNQGEESNFTRMYQHVIKNNIKFNIKEVSKVYYDDDTELRAEEYRIIQQYIMNGEDLKNTNLSDVKRVRRLKRGSYNKKKDSKLSGCIVVLKDKVRVKYSVNGKRKIKDFRITKKRSLKEAMDLAKAFQLEINK